MCSSKCISLYDELRVKNLVGPDGIYIASNLQYSELESDLTHLEKEGISIHFFSHCEDDLLNEIASSGNPTTFDLLSTPFLDTDMPFEQWQANKVLELRGYSKELRVVFRLLIIDLFFYNAFGLWEWIAFKPVDLLRSKLLLLVFSLPLIPLIGSGITFFFNLGLFLTFLISALIAPVFLNLILVIFSLYIGLHKDL